MPPLPGDVYLFATCVIDQFYPQAGIDAIELIEAAGVRVHVPLAATCCGQPAYSSGYSDDARAVAACQLRAFPENWPIVVPSGSCAGMIKHEYPLLFAGSADEATANRIATQVIEWCDFMVQVLHFELNSAHAEQIVIHTACSARREMQTAEHSAALVSRLGGNIKSCEADHHSECCGFGGVFSIKHAGISSSMVSDKVSAYRATGATRIVSADAGCLLNIGARCRYEADSGKPALAVEHIASFVRKLASD